MQDTKPDSTKPISLFDLLDTLDQAQMRYTLGSHTEADARLGRTKHERVITVEIFAPHPIPGRLDEMRVQVCFYHDGTCGIRCFEETSFPNERRLKPIFDLIGVDVSGIEDFDLDAANNANISE